MKNPTAAKSGAPPKPEPDDKEQSKRFIETAKELEADKNAENFERAFKTILPAQKADKQEGKNE
jgi:hypothetical protein